MKTNLFFLMMLVLFFGRTAGAQEKLTLSLDAAKVYALNYNKTMINSGLSVDQSQEKLREAIAAGLPQVNATTDYTNAMGAKISIQFDENAPASQIPIKPTSNFNLQVGQLIFSANYLVGLQSAKIYKRITEKNLEKSGQEIVSQVTGSYYLVLVSDESVKILESNTANLDDVYQRTKPMVEVGMMEQVELDQLLVQVNSLKNALKAAQRQSEIARNILRLQLGVSAETELDLTDTLADLLTGRTIPGSLGKTFSPEQNIDYQLLDIQEEMSEKQVDMSKASYLPSLSGYYSFTHKLLKPAFDMSPAHLVGLNLNIPVFSGGERRSKVKQAEIDLETMRNNRALLQDQLEVQYRQLSYNLKNVLETYELQKQNVEVSREVYKRLKEKFEQGVISGLELTTADNNYLKSESDFLQVKLELLQAQNELNTLTGEYKTIK